VEIPTDLGCSGNSELKPGPILGRSGNSELKSGTRCTRGRHSQLPHRSIWDPISTTCSGGRQKCAVAGRESRARKAKRDSLQRPMEPAEVARKVSRPA